MMCWVIWTDHELVRISSEDVKKDSEGDMKMGKGKHPLSKVRHEAYSTYKCLGCKRTLFVIAFDAKGFCFVECENCGDKRYC